MKKSQAKKTDKPGRGRPKWIPDLEKVKALAQRGLNMQQIADYFGVHIDTICERKKDFSEFSEAIRQGRANGLGIVSNVLMDLIKSRDIQAVKYYMNNVGDWTTNGKVTDNKNSPPENPENKQETDIPDKSKIPEDPNDAIKFYVKIMGVS